MMANGIMTTLTVMSFNRRTPSALPIGAPTQTAIGKTPTAAGTGIPTSAMAGQPITTAVGFSSTAKDGSGCQGMNGRQPGFLGVIRRTTLAGLPFLLTVGVFQSESVSAVGPDLSGEFDRLCTAFYPTTLGFPPAKSEPSPHSARTWRASNSPATELSYT